MTENTNENNDERIAKLEASIAKLTEKNTELLGKLKTAKDAAETAQAEREALAEKAERESNDIEALERRLTAKHKAELERLNAELGNRDKQLSTLLIDNTISAELAKHGVAPQFQKAVAMMMKAEAQLENGSAVAGGKALSDYITDFVKSDEGRHFVAAPLNSGAGPVVPRGSASAWTKAPTTAQELTDWMTFAANPANAAEATALANGWGSPHLAP